MGSAFRLGARDGRRLSAGDCAPLIYLVARVSSAAPCGWIFFDGSETPFEAEEGEELILPGGVFFPAEAHTYASEVEARNAAARLNATSPCFDLPWRCVPAAGIGLAEAKERALPEGARPFRDPETGALRWRR